jgi:broad-specificity NMP kinase
MAEVENVMQRVVILGRGGAGKSTFAKKLGATTGLPVVELDKHLSKAFCWEPPSDPVIFLVEMASLTMNGFRLSQSAVGGNR